MARAPDMASLPSTPEPVSWGYSMGMADTLDAALKEAIRETVAFLEGRGMSAAEAYALCSLAVDFRIGEA